MKKALVFVKSFNGSQVGSIERVVDADKVPAIFLISQGYCKVYDVPENADKDFLKATFVEAVPAQGAKWIKEGEEDVTVQPVVDDGNGNMIADESWTFVPAVEAVEEHYEISEDTSLKAQKVKEVEILAKNKQMDDDIRNDAISLFGTTKENAQFAYINSWLLRVTFPAKYAGQGIKALWPIGSYSVGDELDTEAKISEYYGLLVDSLVTLDVSRDNRIWQYIAEKTAIENS